MRQITSAEFKQAIDIDPAWASTITEPIEITDYCNMKGSNISHLSPLLTFRGKASFNKCKNLKIATGNYERTVSFSESGIEKIENLNCGKSNDRSSAYFTQCENLKIATGDYDGSVHFSYSGVEKIEHLNCGENSNGDSANFSECKNLKIATGNYPGAVNFWNSGIEKIENLNCGKNNNGRSANFSNCENLKIIEGNFPGSINIIWAPTKNLPNIPILKIGNLKTTGITGNPEWNPIFEKISDRWPPEPNRKSLKEWEDLLKPIQTKEGSNSSSSLEKLISNEIQLSKNKLKIAELKNSAVEIEF